MVSHSTPTGHRSILGAGPPPATADDPPFFADLGLDQLISAITAERQHPIAGFFKQPAGDPGVVQHRQAVFQDLDHPLTRQVLDSFCSRMDAMRAAAEMASGQHWDRPRERWQLQSACCYCEAVTGLVDGLKAAPVASAGLRELLGDLARYVDSEQFSALRSEASNVKDQMDAITYSVRLRGDRITVRRYEPAPDYSAEVLATFDRFRQTAADRRRSETEPRPRDVDHVDAAVIDMVARLHPGEFAALEGFAARQEHLVSPLVAGFDHEVRFYLAYLDLINGLRADGLEFCYPQMVAPGEAIHAKGSFDAALAARLHTEGGRVVVNDFELTGPERILVVSGPNQGGKTTFARMFGQLHFLAALGCPVPGRSARLLMCDHVYTHFEQQETLATQAGRLEEDLRRAQPILASATGSSVVVMNEIFSSATYEDAVTLGRKLIDKVAATGAICVIVTFIDEIATASAATVSMVASIDRSRDSDRTYRVLRGPPDGLAYAGALAARYGLTYEALRARILS